MIKLYDGGVYLVKGTEIIPEAEAGRVEQLTGRKACPAEDKKGTIAYSILKSHNTTDDMDHLQIRFDSMASHDITFVGIVQTARASGMEKFPLPYVLTNCHNSLCAVGGTINEDDHKFALSAAHKYGGIYVPTNMAVIHSVNRELMAGCGRMILGSDSHTRYGALGTLAVGEGGGELAKQLVGRTYDMARPGVVAIYLTGSPRPGVGPHDVALSLVGATYANGYVKNKVMEFVGPGVAGLPIEYRNGIDVMTTETTCWSSVWVTDEKTEEYFISLPYVKIKNSLPVDPAEFPLITVMGFSGKCVRCKEGHILCHPAAGNECHQSPVCIARQCVACLLENFPYNTLFRTLVLFEVSSDSDPFVFIHIVLLHRPVKHQIFSFFFNIAQRAE